MTTVQATDTEIITKLIEDNLDLVNHIVFQVAIHFPRHVDRDDLARAGALGLVEAAKRFDESKGVPFQRFAAQRIRGSIIDAVRAADWAPRSVRSLSRKLEATEQRLASRLGRVPHIGEVADELGVSRDELHRLRDRLFRSVILAFDHLVTDSPDEELTLVDVIEDVHSVEPCHELEKRELHAYLRDAIALLPERQRLVIVGYFLQDRTSQDLARFLGVTESRVSQMRTEALEALKRGIEAQYGQDLGEAEAQISGRQVKRRAQFAEAIGERQHWKDRVGDAETLDSGRVLAELLAV
ncbi:MAG TPA: FliA/WhiG family RNA polymerase sigma factor [Microthrixaceae bacterium]|nr:FliA/WhiG family RNA polymerase sigma factor [Microthrixaceae bacterium]HNI35346.1 FliA/WhiG family RNA polymerase sigma factor [Microthrixaceae bacterium]